MHSVIPRTLAHIVQNLALPVVGNVDNEAIVQLKDPEREGGSHTQPERGLAFKTYSVPQIAERLVTCEVDVG
jgi:hypothetical protein